MGKAGGTSCTQIKILGLTEHEEETGIWRIQGGVLEHPLWVLETDRLAGLQHPLLTLVSPQFLEKRRALYDTLSDAGYEDLTGYLLQQVTQFDSMGKEFAMQHLGVEKEMREVVKDLLRKWPVDDVLDLLTVEDRLKGLPVEERLKGLSAEELERLRQLLRESKKTEDNG